MTDETTARVVALGEGVNENEALFIGSLADARDYVHGLDPAARAAVAVVTEGRVFAPDELEGADTGRSR